MISILSEDIRKANETRERKDRIRILTIKKWGEMLNIYVDGGSEEVYARIAKAEKRSQTTCEDCGTDGEERIVGNDYLVCCDKCREEYLS